MKRRCASLALAAWLAFSMVAAARARAQAPRASACLIVYGHARNSGDAAENAAWRIGEPIYSTQRELPLTPRSLERINLTALAEQMVDGYLAAP